MLLPEKGHPAVVETAEIFVNRDKREKPLLLKKSRGGCYLALMFYPSTARPPRRRQGRRVPMAFSFDGSHRRSRSTGALRWISRRGMSVAGRVSSGQRRAGI